jgi:hypothetical protein
MQRFTWGPNDVQVLSVEEAARRLGISVDELKRRGARDATEEGETSD